MELTNKTFDFRFLEHRVAAFQFRGIREARYADVAPTTRKQNSQYSTVAVVTEPTGAGAGARAVVLNARALAGKTPFRLRSKFSLKSK